MIIQIIPAPSDRPCYAVMVDEQGNPDIRRVWAFGVFEELVGPQKMQRIPSGLCCGEPVEKKVPLAKDPNTAYRVMQGYSHLNPVSLHANFVAYAESADPEPWREECKKKLEWIKKMEVELASQVIIRPGKAAMDGLTGKDILH